jgi:hypothetical protein
LRDRSEPRRQPHGRSLAQTDTHSSAAISGASIRRMHRPGLRWMRGS